MRGWWKAPTRFLPCARVHAGLAADRAVDLRQQRGRHLHERQAAQRGRRGEAGEIADHAAAQRDHRGAPLDPRVQQLRSTHVGVAYRGSSTASPGGTTISLRARSPVSASPARSAGRCSARHRLVGHDDRALLRQDRRQQRAGAGAAARRRSPRRSCAAATAPPAAAAAAPGQQRVQHLRRWSMSGLSSPQSTMTSASA